MFYTPKALGVLSNPESLVNFRGEGRLAIHVTVNSSEALVSIGEVNYKEQYDEGSDLALGHFRYLKKADVNRDSFNGIVTRDIIEMELKNLGEYKDFFDVIVHDLSQRRTTLVSKAQKPAMLIRDKDGNMQFKLIS